MRLSRGDMRAPMLMPLPLPTSLSTRSEESGGLAKTYPTAPAHGEEFAGGFGREFGDGLGFRAFSAAALHRDQTRA
jgi:hypothetical protein